MNTLSFEAPPARPDRYASALLHDEPNARIVAFHLLPGQAVPPHHSPSTVVVQVLEGEGIFRGESGEAVLSPGQTAVYAPGETHSMEPREGALRFLVIITPRPQ